MTPKRRIGRPAAIAALVLFSSAAAGAQGLPPQTLIIDVLGNRFGPVRFDHALHAAYAACTECHHHTAGSPASDPRCRNCHRSATTVETVSCRSCHPERRFAPEYLESLHDSPRHHIDIPGLKGAFHLTCLVCHEAVGAGPTSCDGCHRPLPERTASHVENPHP